MYVFVCLCVCVYVYQMLLTFAQGAQVVRNPPHPLRSINRISTIFECKRSFIATKILLCTK